MRVSLDMRKIGRAVFTSEDEWPEVFREAADWLEKEKPQVWTIHCYDAKDDEYEDCKIDIYYYEGDER